MQVLVASTSKSSMVVFMKLSDKYAVPRELALLYDFVNSLDRRRYVEGGVAHTGGDEIETPRLLETWMRERGLVRRGQHIDAEDHRAALELRKTLRDYLLTPPEQRRKARETARQLTAASERFPLVVAISDKGSVELAPIPGSNGLGNVLAQTMSLAETGRLARLRSPLPRRQRKPGHCKRHDQTGRKKSHDFILPPTAASSATCSQSKRG